MKDRIVGYKANVFLKKCQGVLLKMLVSPKTFGEAKEHLLTEGGIRTYCCYMLLSVLFLKLLPVDIAFVGMVINP